MEDGRWKMEFAVRSPLVLTERNPFVRAVAHPKILAVQLPVMASVSPEIAAEQAWIVAPLV
jgi:hypothetical protein